MASRNIFLVMLSALLTIACTTTTPSVTQTVTKSERVLGQDDDVRVEAVVVPDPLSSGNIRIICEIENRRPEPIVIYDVQSLAIYDPDTRTFTVNLGAEVPTLQSHPVRILSAERRVFEQTVNISSPFLHRLRNFIRVRLHFLKNAVGLSMPDDEGLPSVVAWAEQKRTVDTNSIPVF